MDAPHVGKTGMFTKLSNRYPQLVPVAARIWFEARLPLIAAICWGSVAHLFGRDFFTSLSGAGAAFFFFLFAQGQVLRIQKNVRDEQDAEHTRASFASLQQGIDELRARVPMPQPLRKMKDEPLVQYSGHRMVSLGWEFFLAEAMQAVESGQYYAGAVAAAVGFEYATREAAKQLGIDGDTLALGRLVRDVSRRTEDKNATEALITLNRLRNSLIHPDKNMLEMNREQAFEIVDAFNRGVSYLDMAG
jgi:hypothetical protein